MTKVQPPELATSPNPRRLHDARKLFSRPYARREASQPGRCWGRFTRGVSGVGLLAGSALIILSSCATLTPLQVLRDHSGTVSSVAWSPDGKQLASTGYGDGTLKIWDPAAGTAPRVLP